MLDSCAIDALNLENYIYPFTIRAPESLMYWCQNFNSAIQLYDKISKSFVKLQDIDNMFDALYVYGGTFVKDISLDFLKIYQTYLCYESFFGYKKLKYSPYLAFDFSVVGSKDKNNILKELSHADSLPASCAISSNTDRYNLKLEFSLLSNVLQENNNQFFFSIEDVPKLKSKKTLLILAYPIYSHSNIFSSIINAVAQDFSIILFTTRMMKDYFFKDLNGLIKLWDCDLQDLAQYVKKMTQCNIETGNDCIAEEGPKSQAKFEILEHCKLELMEYLFFNRYDIDGIMYDTGFSDALPLFVAKTFNIPHVIRFFPNFLGYDNDIIPYEKSMNFTVEEKKAYLDEIYDPWFNTSYIEQNAPMINIENSSMITRYDLSKCIKIRPIPKGYVEDNIVYDNKWILMGNRFGFTKEEVKEIAKNLKNEKFPDNASILTRAAVKK
jgi:hypothetical protein